MDMLWHGLPLTFAVWERLAGYDHAAYTDYTLVSVAGVDTGYRVKSIRDISDASVASAVAEAMVRERQARRSAEDREREAESIYHLAWGDKESDGIQCTVELKQDRGEHPHHADADVVGLYLSARTGTEREELFWLDIPLESVGALLQGVFDRQNEHSVGGCVCHLNADTAAIRESERHKRWLAGREAKVGVAS